MLQVIRPTGKGSIYTVGSAYVGAVNCEVNPYIYEVFNPEFYLFPSYDTSLSIQGDITTTPSDLLQGENSCHHVNFTGDIIPVHQFVDVPVSWTPTVATSIDSPWGKLQCSAPITTYPRSRSRSTHIYDFKLPISYERSFKMIVHTLSSGDQSRIGYFLYSKRIFPRYHVISYSRTVYNEYDGWNSLYGQWVIEYDALRGVRLSAPCSDRWTTRIFQTIKELETYLDSIYSRAWQPVGAYSWENGCMTRTGSSETGLWIAEDSRLVSTIQARASELTPVELPKLGEMSYDCCAQMSPYNGNSLALVHDLLTLKKQVSSVVSLLANWENPKSWASLFLSAKYGIPLTFKDMKKLIISLQETLSLAPNAKVSSSRNWSSKGCIYESHYSIYYNPIDSRLVGIIPKLKEFHLIPDYSDLWDFIPFSFVVDWFINVGALLEKVDTISEFSKYDIQGCMFSLKITKGITPEQLGFPGYKGNIILTKYDRTISSSACPPSIARSTTTPPTFDHWIEGTALMVQKIFN